MRGIPLGVLEILPGAGDGLVAAGFSAYLL